MNKEIAENRYKTVLRMDVITNTQGDFLATHVPFKNLVITDHAELTRQEKQQTKTEEEAYLALIDPKDEDQFVLVKGSSGTGKSHLIRWFDAMIESRKPDNETVLFIKRNDNTLKGTIRQLLDMPEIQHIPNKEAYKRLLSAATTIPESELKATIYYNYLIKIESDDGKGDIGDVRRLSNVDRKHLIALMENALFKSRMMADGGPIDRILAKLGNDDMSIVKDEVAGFTASDFDVNIDFYNALINDGADSKARKIIENRIMATPNFTTTLADYLNTFNDDVMQRCSGLEPGDLGQVFVEIRQELKKQNRSLTLFIEDITAFTGVNSALIDVLTTNRAGMYDSENLCRINAIVGSTDGYYNHSFKENYKERIRHFITIDDDVFVDDPEGLIQFFARYLNTISLDENSISEWLRNGAKEENYPVHQATICKGWCCYPFSDGKEINLFPFTRQAITALIMAQEPSGRKPRSLIRNIIEPYIQECFGDLNSFPQEAPTVNDEDKSLRRHIYNRKDIDEKTKIRLFRFMSIWGDGTQDVYVDDGIKYIGGIEESIYSELGLPIVEGKLVKKNSEAIRKPSVAEDAIGYNTSKQSVDQKTLKAQEEVSDVLHEVDKWIEHKDVKLNIGQTTKNVRGLNDARKNMNDYLFSVIDWASEGVPIDAMIKIRDTANKFLVAFERQTMKSDAVITLTASIESSEIIEAFVRWSIEGNKSWNYDGSNDLLYRVECWTERIKPLIINEVMHTNGSPIKYFDYATAAEYYRLILNGYCRAFQKTKNLQPSLLLNDNKGISNDISGHTKAWNDLVKITNGSDGVSNRKIVLQYYNILQGTSVKSSNYEFDIIEFNKAVNKVVSKGLYYSDYELQLDDPVRKRRLTSEYLKKILDRIGIVVEDEKNEITRLLRQVKILLELDEIESADDIKTLIKQIKNFYNKAEACHISIAATQNNSELIAQCQKNVNEIFSSINTSKQVILINDDVEALLLLSKDPLKWLSAFTQLLTKVAFRLF